MAIELSRLIKRVEHMDITLLAGEKGLRNLVSWTHIVETIEASSFLDGGEIVFTTGLGINNYPPNLINLIKSIFDRNASGIIINTGPFLSEVPQSAIDFCNEHDFPLFVVPWKIHLAEIMRIFCFSITKDDQKNLEISSAFKNAIFLAKHEELYMVPLSQRNFLPDWKYAVCGIYFSFPNNNISTDRSALSRIESLTYNLQNHMRHYQNFAIFSYDIEIIVVMANYTKEMQTIFVNDLKGYVQRYLLGGETFLIGIGRQTKSIRCLYKSYRQAKAIQKLQSNQKIDPAMIFYSDMGIYQLLMGIEDNEVIAEYYEKTIHPLVDYDNKNNSNLTDILKCYLTHDGSVKETADELFVHRNTINYKLNKIEELLDMDLSALNTRFQLMIGFMLQDMI